MSPVNGKLGCKPAHSLKIVWRAVQQVARGKQQRTNTGGRLRWDCCTSRAAEFLDMHM
jgi:hypothetical protein